MGLLPSPKKAAQAKIEEVKGNIKAIPGNIVKSATTGTCRLCGRTLPLVQLRKDGTSRVGGGIASRGKVVQNYKCKNAQACNKAKNKANGNEGVITHRRRHHPGAIPMDDV